MWLPQSAPQRPRRSWGSRVRKSDWLIPVLTAALTVLGVFVSSSFGWLSKDRELDIRLVEIGISILRAKPDETGVTPARQWAIDVIEKHSGTKFSKADRQALLQKQLDFVPGDFVKSNLRRALGDLELPPPSGRPEIPGQP
jgi:hypothetical protein